MKKMILMLFFLGLLTAGPLVRVGQAHFYWNVGYSPYAYFGYHYYNYSRYLRYSSSNSLGEYRYHRQMLETLTALGESKKEGWLKPETTPLVTSVQPQTNMPETSLDLPQIKTDEAREL